MGSFIKLCGAGVWGFRSWTEAITNPLAVGECAEAVAYFREILGEDWPRPDGRTPLATQFFTSFQGAPPEGVRLLRMIRALDGAPNITPFVQAELGATTWTRYLAAAMSLEFCSRFRLHGCDTEFFETASEKRADVRITIAKRPVTVEFKSLHDVDEYQPWEDLEEYLASALAPHGLNFGSFEIELTLKALADREAIAEGLVAVNSSGAHDFQQLPRGTGQAKIADRMGRLSLPIRQYDDVSRILAKLKSKWWRQLQKVRGPAVVVVRAANLFGCRAAERLMVLHRLVAELEELLPKRKMISAMVVYDEIPGQYGSSGVLDRGTFRIAVGPSQDGCSRTAVLVPNPDPRVRLDADECERLVGSNMLW